MGSANGNISFLHALPRVLSLTLEKLLPLVCFPLSLQKWTPRTVHSIFKIQNPDFCKITSKTLPAFSPQSFKSLSCLPGDSASIVLFNLFEEMTRKRLNGFYCLIIIWSFVEQSAGQLHSFMIWWLRFLFNLNYRDNYNSTKRNRVGKHVLFMFLF